MSKIGKNLTVLLVSQLMTWGITFVLLFEASRHLGAEKFGQVGFAITYVGFFTIAASLGTGTLLTRLVARDSSQIGPYVFNAVLLKVIGSIVLSGVAIALAPLAGAHGKGVVLVAIACLGMLLSALNEVFIGALSGLESMSRPALWNTLQMYIGSGLAIVLLVNGAGVVPFFIASTVPAIIPVVANGRALWGWTSEHRRIDTDVIRRIVVGGAPLITVSALSLVYGTIDVPILNHIAGATEVGWYTFAYRLVSIPLFIATATATAFLPAMSVHGASLSSEFSRHVNRALRLVVLVSIPAAAGIAAIAQDLIRILSDAEFQNSMPLIRILALQIPLVGIDMILAMAAIASDRQNRYLLLAGSAAVISPVAATFAIRWSMHHFDNGAIGASIVTVGIEALIMVGSLRLRAKGVLDLYTTFYAVRVLVAGAAMGGLVWLLDDWPLLVRVGVGLVSYALAAVALGTVRIAEIKDAVRKATRLRGGIPTTE